jgi:hypothetical protein
MNALMNASVIIFGRSVASPFFDAEVMSQSKYSFLGYGKKMAYCYLFMKLRKET